MSKYSIEKNNEIIEEIKVVIKKYEDAISKIEEGNNNNKSKEIVHKIKNDIELLKKIKKNIELLNKQIEIQLRNAKERERKKIEGELNVS